LKKDTTIVQLLEILRDRLGAGAFEVVDHWEADMSAIGIASPRDHRVLAYLGCFGREPGSYDVELESPAEMNGFVREHRNVDLEILVRVVREHLSCG
jgi:hypothetical protein